MYLWKPGLASWIPIMSMASRITCEREEEKNKGRWRGDGLDFAGLSAEHANFFLVKVMEGEEKRK